MVADIILTGGLTVSGPSPRTLRRTGSAGHMMDHFRVFSPIYDTLMDPAEQRSTRLWFNAILPSGQESIVRQSCTDLVSDGPTPLHADLRCWRSLGQHEMGEMAGRVPDRGTQIWHFETGSLLPVESLTPFFEAHSHGLSSPAARNRVLSLSLSAANTTYDSLIPHATILFITREWAESHGYTTMEETVRSIGGPLQLIFGLWGPGFTCVYFKGISEETTTFVEGAFPDDGSGAPDVGGGWEIYVSTALAIMAGEFEPGCLPPQHRLSFMYKVATTLALIKSRQRSFQFGARLIMEVTTHCVTRVYGPGGPGFMIG